MSEDGVKPPWNKWRGPACGEEAVYAAKGLDAGVTTNAPGCWVGWMFLTRPAATRRVRGLGQSPMGCFLSFYKMSEM